MVGTAYVAVLVVKVLTLRWAATELPPRVASHFGPRGRPDGWMSRRSFLLLEGALAVVTVVGIPLLASLLARYADAGLNIPHREAWLLPEHRDELVRRLELDGLAMGALTGALLAWIDVAVVRANRLAEPRLGRSVWVVTGAFVAAVSLGVLYVAVWQFRSPG